MLVPTGRRRGRSSPSVAAAASLLSALLRSVALLPSGALGQDPPPRVCPAPPSSDTACTTVDTYPDFESIVENASSGSTITFCPFDLTIESSSTTTITTDVHVRCRDVGQCKLSGGDTQIRITRSGAKATVQGFVLAGTDGTALRIWSRADENEQAICDCHFEGNTAGAISMDENTMALIARSSFVNNKGDDNGGAILSSGTARVDDCTFEDNEAELGGAIYSSSDGYLELSNSIFTGNVASEGGPAVYLEESGSDRFKDGGNNKGEDDMLPDAEGGNAASNCLGVYSAGDDACVVEFGPVIPPEPSSSPSSTPSASPSASPSSSPSVSSAPTVSLMPSSNPTVSAAPSASPSSSPSAEPTFEKWKSHPTPRNKKGYYNYDPEDDDYGPGRGWESISHKDVEDLYAYKYWKTWDRYLGKQLRYGMKHNYCREGRYDDEFSPIDLNVKDLNAECEEYHQLRRKGGKLPLDHVDVKMQILMDRLRILWPVGLNQVEEGAQGPKGDVPKGWGDHYAVVHADVVMSSSHTMEGKEYPGELQINFMTTRGRGIPIFSIFMDYDPEDKDNEYFQTAIDEWQKTYDADEEGCLGARRKERRRTQAAGEGGFVSNNSTLAGSAETNFQNLRGEEGRRDLTHEKKKHRPFNIFHESIFVTEWWYGYVGTLDYPPCYPMTEWRVLDKPMHLSRKQMRQLERILFTHRNGAPECEYTSNHHEGKASRKVHKANGRDIHRCSCIDYEIDYLRLEFGPNFSNCRKIRDHPWFRRECPPWWEDQGLEEPGVCPSWWTT